jgi:hypothetical protein
MMVESPGMSVRAIRVERLSLRRKPEGWFADRNETSPQWRDGLFAEFLNQVELCLSERSRWSLSLRNVTIEVLDQVLSVGITGRP